MTSDIWHFVWGFSESLLSFAERKINSGVNDAIFGVGAA